jgi:hypothetical protein
MVAQANDNWLEEAQTAETSWICNHLNIPASRSPSIPSLEPGCSQNLVSSWSESRLSLSCLFWVLSRASRETGIIGVAKSEFLGRRLTGRYCVVFEAVEHRNAYGRFMQ